MENIAYLHLAFTYEERELLSLSSLFQNTPAPDWKRLSSQAWKYLLTLALLGSIFSTFSGMCISVLALEKGDQGPSVKNLQEKLKAAGFYQAPITQVYDLNTENAVKHFQKVAGLSVSGVVEPDTMTKLGNWQEKHISSHVNPNLPKTRFAQRMNVTGKNYKTSHPLGSKTIATNSVTPKLSKIEFLRKGDEGEQVTHLQASLRIAGFYHGNPTGIFGPITEESVKQFQKAYKLTPDGIVGAATIAKLSAFTGNNLSDIPKNSGNGDSLTIGDRGESVRILQEELAKAGYLASQPNGYYGSHTADAVRRFQKNHHLEVNGMAGPATRAKLFNLVKTPESDFHVLEIQRRLQNLGFYKGQLNGKMADNTKKAIQHAQEFYGISMADFKNN